MSIQDRRAEREVADFYHQAALGTPQAKPVGTPWNRFKRQAGAFFTGVAIGSVIRKLF